ncbi:MAG TPA: PEP-CTERM sorting domain-containing protein [Albitalea sp.]
MTPHWKLSFAGLCALIATTTAHAVPISGQGSWESTLQSRDIDGDGTIDAFYDTVLDITWLADANFGAGSAFDDGLSPSDGDMSWSSALAWAASLDIHGVTGWRLPEMNPGSTVHSELSHMYYETLGNFGPGNPLTSTPPGTWGFTNTALFTQLESEWFWTGTADLPGATAWVFAGDPISGYHSAEPIVVGNRAWAVRDGDVPVIPEPSTYALMLLGLAGVAAVAARCGRRGGLTDYSSPARLTAR